MTPIHDIYYIGGKPNKIFKFRDTLFIVESEERQPEPSGSEVQIYSDFDLNDHSSSFTPQTKI